MTNFYVIQPDLTDEQSARVNTVGWDASPETTAYANLMAGSDTVGAVEDAINFKLYTLTHSVEADGLEAAFATSNGHGAGFVSRFVARRKSMSVADIVVYKDPETDKVTTVVCAGFGFEPAGERVSRYAERMVLESLL